MEFDMDTLLGSIYHEKQERGSMMCAQHALNSLLQGNYYSAPDLSQIAQRLDQLERSYRELGDITPGRSTNMDDTGFFSVQVLEEALQVWNLSLVRWRSEEMQHFQSEPDTQQAFILNLQSHWFTIRRFGRPYPEQGHWFNLNSFLEHPEWVSKTYLGMVLQQAEQEGYSVFVVRLHDGEPQALIDRPLTGTLTEADEAASLMLEPTSMPSSAATLSTSRKPNSSRHPTTSSPTAEGFEDEDMDLQRALQASLAGGDFDDDPDVVQYQPQPQPLSSRNHFGPSASTSTSRSRPQDTASHDAIQQSIARGQELLERTRREQELAFHEGLQYSYEAAAAGTSTGRRMRSQAQAPPTRTRSGDEEEEEMMRRALEASMKARKEAGADARGDDEDDSDDAAFLDAEEDIPTPPSLGATRRTLPSSPLLPPHPSSTSTLPPVHSQGPRVLDDEDQDLQNALKMSLEGLPPGFQIPDIERAQHGGARGPVREPSGDSNESMEEEESGDEKKEDVEEMPSMEEMRRRRMARFGA